ncbi:MAG: ATP-binding cassette domain-containing protein [Ilumatobacteraceae bacterium]
MTSPTMTSRAETPTNPQKWAGPAGGTYLLRVEIVTKRYGDHTVVEDLSFTVPPGRVTGFLGPNGSGKSTTSKIMLDLARADEGSASIGGHRYRELSDLADATGISQSRVDEMLEQVGLADVAGTAPTMSRSRFAS